MRWCHEMALELVCLADLLCNPYCKTSPVDLDGFWSHVWPISGQTAFRYPQNHFVIWASVATFGYGCGYDLCGCNLRLSEVRPMFFCTGQREPSKFMGFGDIHGPVAISAQPR
jgi:hypothetical protein